MFDSAAGSRPLRLAHHFQVKDRPELVQFRLDPAPLNEMGSAMRRGSYKPVWRDGFRKMLRDTQPHDAKLRHAFVTVERVKGSGRAMAKSIDKQCRREAARTIPAALVTRPCAAADGVLGEGEAALCAENRTSARRCVSAGLWHQGAGSLTRVDLDVSLRTAMPR
jgi:hypothetical protein